MHLIMDGKANNHHLLTDSWALTMLLVEAVDVVGMQKISAPMVVEYPAGNGKERGLSGVIFLAESSITIHTYPEYGFVFIDVFSCKPFDCDKVEANLCRAFQLKSPKIIQFDRGIDKGIITPVTLREV